MNKRVQKGHYRATPWPGFRRFRGFGLPLAGWFKGWRWRLTPQIIKKAGPRPPSFRPKRSGVEKSPPLMVRVALRREISRLRVSSKRFPSVSHSGTYLRSR